MKKAYTLILSATLIATGCGVKGAPMPRRDEVFIEKTLIQSTEASDEEVSKKSKSKKEGMTILPKKDPR